MAKVMIIGGGVAGLSAGIYARLSGHEAIVCEKHVIAGGNLTGWSRGGYHIDNCIHWLTGTNKRSIYYKMWEKLGILGDGVEQRVGKSLFSCERDGIRVSLTPSLGGLYREMMAISPEDSAEIMKLCYAIELIMAVEHIAGKNCDKGISVGRLFNGLGPLLKYYGLTTGQLAKRFKSPALQCFITGFWGDDFGAFALLYVFATYCGRNGFLPEGGSLKSAERMAQRFKSLDGQLRLGCEVKSVNMDGKRASSVTFADGSTEETDFVILATDPAVTFGKILDLPMPKKLKKHYDNPKLTPFSAYQAAFACDSAELPFEGDLIFDVPSEYAEELGTRQLIVREFSHEPSFAPEGKNILQTLTFCFGEDCEEFIRLRREDMVGYKAKKKRLTEILQMLIENHCPTLRGRLTLIDAWTPASYERYVNSRVGSFMSFAIPEKFLPIPLGGGIKGAKNVFMATQWLQSPGGLPIAAQSGMFAVKKINRRSSRKVKMKS